MSEKNVFGEDRTGNPFRHEACDFDSMTSIVKVHGRKKALILMQIQPFRCFSEEETGKRASGIPEFRSTRTCKARNVYRLRSEFVDERGTHFGLKTELSSVVEKHLPYRGKMGHEFGT